MMPIEKLRELLALDAPADAVGPDGERKAAVLVPFFKEEGIWKIIYTRRTELVQDHKGQVSFPGGRWEPGDPTLPHTALREAYEEIGLEPDNVDVLGMMDPFVTVTNYLIYPVIGVVQSRFEYHPSVDEVARIFTMPVDWLADPKNHSERLYEHPSGFKGMSIYFEPYENEILWGITARITVNLMKMLYE